jgi:transposase
MPTPVAVEIVLSDEERAHLESWERRRTSAQALAERSPIVLAAAEGLKNTEIAERRGVHRQSVTKWRNRFAEYRLDGLVDEPRPGRPRTITDEMVDAVITRTLESASKNATHWSTRSMAAEVGLTQTAVSKIWRAFGLYPHRQDAWTLSNDPLFVREGSRRRRALSQPARARSRCVWMRSPRSRR